MLNVWLDIDITYHLQAWKTNRGNHQQLSIERLPAIAHWLFPKNSFWKKIIELKLTNQLLDSFFPGEINESSVPNKSNKHYLDLEWGPTPSPYPDGGFFFFKNLHPENWGKILTILTNSYFSNGLVGSTINQHTFICSCHLQKRPGASKRRPWLGSATTPETRRAASGGRKWLRFFGEWGLVEKWATPQKKTQL